MYLNVKICLPLLTDAEIWEYNYFPNLEIILSVRFSIVSGAPKRTFFVVWCVFFPCRWNVLPTQMKMYLYIFRFWNKTQATEKGGYGTLSTGANLFLLFRKGKVSYIGQLV